MTGSLPARSHRPVAILLSVTAFLAASVLTVIAIADITRRRATRVVARSTAYVPEQGAPVWVPEQAGPGEGSVTTGHTEPPTAPPPRKGESDD